MTAKAAYRAGERIHDERTGTTHDYRAKGAALHSEITLPENAPSWMRDRAKLWNAAEQGEKRKDSQVGRELRFSLPAELQREEWLTISRDVARHVTSRHHAAVDWSIHEPSKDGDERNYHVHMLISTRRVGRDGFTAEKLAELDDRRTSGAEIETMRAEVAAAVNRALERNGIVYRVDHRSFERQGKEQDPTQHLGPAATAKERRGETTERGDFNRAARAANRLRDHLNERARFVSGVIERDREKARQQFADRQRWKATRRDQRTPEQRAAEVAFIERQRFDEWSNRKRAVLARDQQEKKAAELAKLEQRDRNFKASLDRKWGAERRAAEEAAKGIEARQKGNIAARAFRKLSGREAKDRTKLAELHGQIAAVERMAGAELARHEERMDRDRRDIDRLQKIERDKLEGRIASVERKREAEGWTPQPKPEKAVNPIGEAAQKAKERTALEAEWKRVLSERAQERKDKAAADMEAALAARAAKQASPEQQKVSQARPSRTQDMDDQARRSATTSSPMQQQESADMRKSGKVLTILHGWMTAPEPPSEGPPHPDAPLSQAAIEARATAKYHREAQANLRKNGEEYRDRLTDAGQTKAAAILDAMDDPAKRREAWKESGKESQERQQQKGRDFGLER